MKYLPIIQIDALIVVLLNDHVLFCLSVGVVILNFLCSGAYTLLVAYTLENGMSTLQYGYLGAVISCGGLLGMFFVSIVKIAPDRR